MNGQELAKQMANFEWWIMVAWWTSVVNFGFQLFVLLIQIICAVVYWLSCNRLGEEDDDDWHDDDDWYGNGDWPEVDESGCEKEIDDDWPHLRTEYGTEEEPCSKKNERIES